MALFGAAVDPNRAQLVAILAAAALLFLVLEMVRRRRLMERYALLWVLAAAILIGLATWRNGLKLISDAVGIFYPPTTLFIVAFVFVLLLLLHFSAAVSRLSDQTRVLAQRVALLEQRLRTVETIEEADEAEEPEFEGVAGPGGHARN